MLVTVLFGSGVLGQLKQSMTDNINSLTCSNLGLHRQTFHLKKNFFGLPSTD